MRCSVGNRWWKLVAINVKHLMCIKPGSIAMEGVRGGTTGIGNRQVKHSLSRVGSGGQLRTS